MRFSTFLTCLLPLAGLVLLVLAHVDYGRHLVDDLTSGRDYLDEIVARDAPMNYQVRSQLISQFATRELVDELKSRLHRRSPSGKFHKAVSIINSLPRGGRVQVSQADKLFLYKYLKQANEGDNKSPRPSALDAVGKVKWDAWNSVRGVHKGEAEKQYVNKVLAILQAAGDRHLVADIRAA